MSVAGSESCPDTAGARAYSVAFFDKVGRSALRSAEVIVPILMDVLHPTSVVDVGSARGTWLAVFRSAGVQDILGLDGPWVDIATLEIPRDNFMVVDLERPIELSRRFDLAISLEVAEHLTEEKADSFVASLVRLSQVVMFSAAIPFQGGTDHRNEQWQSYWAERFARHDFIPIDWIRPRVWDRVDVETWYAQNTLIYVANRDLAKYSELLAEANRSPIPLTLVHPRKYLQMVQMREQAMRLADPRNMSLARFLLSFPAVCRGFLRRRVLKRSNPESGGRTSSRPRRSEDSLRLHAAASTDRDTSDDCSR